MKPAPLISDSESRGVEQELEFGRTPEFQFTATYLTEPQAQEAIKNGHTGGSPAIIEAPEITALAGTKALVTARIFTAFDFGRYEAVVRAIQRAGYRPAVISEGESLIKTDGFWQILGRDQFFPLCCFGSELSFDGRKYFPFITEVDKGPLLYPSDVAWRVDVREVVFCRYAYLGIKV
jgi:hypothetical protein